MRSCFKFSDRLFSVNETHKIENGRNEKCPPAKYKNSCCLHDIGTSREYKNAEVIILHL